MRPYALILALVVSMFVWAIPAQAATGTVDGTVRLGNDISVVMAGVDVVVVGTSIKTKSKNNGNFVLTGVPVGLQQIKAVKAGLQDGVANLDVNGTANGWTPLDMIDNAPPLRPATPISFASSAGYRSDANLLASWQPFTDGWGISRYELRWREETKNFSSWISTGQVNNAPKRSMILSGLKSNTLYFIEVRAWGLEGKASATATASAQTQIAPTGVITVPADGATVSGVVTFTSHIQAGPAATYWIKVGGTTIVNNEAVAAGTSDVVAAATWDTRDYSNAPYKLAIQVKDAEGNFSAITSVSVNVDNPVTGYADGFVRTYAADGVTLLPVIGEILVASRAGYATVRCLYPTGKNGNYRFPPLDAGLWSISIAPDHFQGSTKSNIQISSGKGTRVSPFVLLPYAVPSFAQVGTGPSRVTVNPATNNGNPNANPYNLDYDIQAKRITVASRDKGWTFDPVSGIQLGQWWDMASIMPTHFVPDYSQTNKPMMFAARGGISGARFPASGAPIVNPGAKLISWNVSAQQDGLFGSKEVMIADQTAVLRMRAGLIVDRYDIPTMTSSVRTEVMSLTASQRSIFLLLQSTLTGGGVEYWLERHDRDNLAVIENSERLNFRGGLVRLLDGYGTIAVVEAPDPSWATYSTTPDKIHWFRASDLAEIGTPLTIAPDAATGAQNRIMGLASSFEHGKLWILTNRAGDGLGLFHWYGVN